MADHTLPEAVVYEMTDVGSHDNEAGSSDKTTSTSFRNFVARRPLSSAGVAASFAALAGVSIYLIASNRVPRRFRPSWASAPGAPSYGATSSQPQQEAHGRPVGVAAAKPGPPSYGATKYIPVSIEHHHVHARNTGVDMTLEPDKETVTVKYGGEETTCSLSDLRELIREHIPGKQGEGLAQKRPSTLEDLSQWVTQYMKAAPSTP